MNFISPLQLLQQKNQKSLLNERGMTLLEIMIVLLILGGLITILSTTVFGRLSSAKVKEAKIHIGELGKTLEMYYGDCNTYPSTEQGLAALIQAPTIEPTCSGWGPEGYLKKMPKDPWGNDYVYESQGTSYVLKSLGKDKREGGTGESADISSENL